MLVTAVDSEYLGITPKRNKNQKISSAYNSLKIATPTLLNLISRDERFTSKFD